MVGGRRVSVNAQGDGYGVYRCACALLDLFPFFLVWSGEKQEVRFSRTSDRRGTLAVWGCRSRY